jgi:Trk K+ transport system NAD-binding subunit
MRNPSYLLMRRLRLPLIILILTYATAIFGLVLIPGVDEQGRPWHMDFFHAFYFVSFLGSTIGFGEIPFPFTDAQRLWTTVVIYAAVVSWLYAIGTILTVVQDPGFKRVRSRMAFVRQIRRLQRPFYLICGYGDAGSLLVRELTERGFECVVVEISEETAAEVEMANLLLPVPWLCADATDSDVLIAAGLKLFQCQGVVALTGADNRNLTIAITSKLLSPHLPVICQSDTQDAAANMASFGTDHIIDPFEIFARRFAMMFHSPGMYLVHEWITSIYDSPLPEFRSPPKGDWVLCGFGRFGKAVSRHLVAEGVDIRIVEATPGKVAAPPGTIKGRGTEADTLLKADIRSAAGIVAGTDDDSNNLSIIMTAKDLNRNLFTVARQNERTKAQIFEVATPHLTMHPANIVVQHALGKIMAPLLSDFLRLTHDKDESWANVLVSRVAGVARDDILQTWDQELIHKRAPALFAGLLHGEKFTLAHLCSDPRDPTESLPCIPLLLKRGNQTFLLPEPAQLLQPYDRLLFCGRPEAAQQIHHLVYDQRALHYLLTGHDRPSGTLWRLLAGP